jgi:hypothetical protein
MSSVFLSVLHQGEAIDPTLIEWIQHKISELVGLGPGAIALGLGVVIVAVPIGLGVAAVRRRRALDE